MRVILAVLRVSFYIFFSGELCRWSAAFEGALREVFLLSGHLDTSTKWHDHYIMQVHVGISVHILTQPMFCFVCFCTLVSMCH